MCLNYVMPISKSKSLILLIKRLSKPEKRHFSLYFNRLESNNDSKTLLLFKLIESKNEINDIELQKRMRFTNAQQFSNLKRHLFSQILISLRLLYAKKLDEIELREYMDFAEILRIKALYNESLQLLNKCHNYNTEENHQMKYLIEEKASKIQWESQIFEDYTPIDDLSGFNQSAAGYFISGYDLTKQEFLEIGYSKNNREKYLRSLVMKERLKINDVIPQSALDSYNINYQLALHNHACFKDRLAYRYSLWAYENLKDSKTVSTAVREYDLFELILRICKALNDISRMQYWLETYEKRLGNYSNSESINDMFLRIRFYELYRVQLFIFQNKLKQAYELVTELMYQYNAIDSMSDSQLRAQLWFTKACICSDQGQYDEAIEYCHKLMQYTVDIKNKGLILYARLLHLMSHYRLNNLMYVENNIVNVRNAFLAQDSMTRSVEILLVFLRKGVRAHNFGLKDDISELVDKFELLRRTPYEKVTFYYYDFSKWMNSLKFNISVERYLEIKENDS